jgi:uracil-DNA glycosylase
MTCALPQQPGHDCPLCDRLVAYRAANRAAFPDFFNGPVPAWGDPGARLLIVGLAPGVRGANRTGRPFTGDYAGDLLYSTLLQYGFASGVFEARPDDSLTLQSCRIANAVRCVPPENKPVGDEIKRCNAFLAQEIAALPYLRVIVALGGIAHGAVLSALKQRKSAFSFAHAAQHSLPGGLHLLDSYHCSRYNTNTRRLTPEMFHTVFAKARALCDSNA